LFEKTGIDWLQSIPTPMHMPTIVGESIFAVKHEKLKTLFLNDLSTNTKSSDLLCFVLARFITALLLTGNTPDIVVANGFYIGL
jgi:hypothetical protein